MIGSDRIGAWVRNRIKRMLELYKRFWQVFLPLFAVFGLGSLQAFYYLNEYKYQWIVVSILLVLALICFIIGIIGLVNSIKDARRKDRGKKQEDIHNALIESFKRIYIKQGKSEEEAQKMAEFAAENRPPSPPIEGEEDWMSPQEAYVKSHRKNWFGRLKKH